MFILTYFRSPEFFLITHPELVLNSQVENSQQNSWLQFFTIFFSFFQIYPLEFSARSEQRTAGDVSSISNVSIQCSGCRYRTSHMLNAQSQSSSCWTQAKPNPSSCPFLDRVQHEFVEIRYVFQRFLVRCYVFGLLNLPGDRKKQVGTISIRVLLLQQIPSRNRGLSILIHFSYSFLSIIYVKNCPQEFSKLQWFA